MIAYNFYSFYIVYIYMSMLIEHPRTRPRFIGRYYQWFWYIKEKWPSALGLSIIFLLKPNCVIVVEYTLWFDLFRFCILYFYNFWKYASVLDLEAHWARINISCLAVIYPQLATFPFFVPPPGDSVDLWLK